MFVAELVVTRIGYAGVAFGPAPTHPVGKSGSEKGGL